MTPNAASGDKVDREGGRRTKHLGMVGVSVTDTRLKHKITAPAVSQSTVAGFCCCERLQKR